MKTITLSFIENKAVKVELDVQTPRHKNPTFMDPKGFALAKLANKIPPSPVRLNLLKSPKC